MTITLAFLAALAVGYLIGRYRPAHRASDWAHWQKYDRAMRRHSARWWTRFVILSAENLGWLVAHPRQGWDAWKHRNDPRTTRSPAVQIRSVGPGPTLPVHRVSKAQEANE
ncbi:hypothetical protein [Streptomyces sp. NBRC 110035]|uniref:hypothetical protein n=1 Tax=Streptomyces sp. NBRC 110035 TaxID=1547867 RepID=UPI000697B399|nr:hypothetical protein [Streptomyces sp. NBRC 110035]